MPIKCYVYLFLVKKCNLDPDVEVIKKSDKVVRVIRIMNTIEMNEIVAISLQLLTFLSEDLCA